MVVFPAPFSQVNGHLLPFQADELNPAPVDQGLLPPRSAVCRPVSRNRADASWGVTLGPVARRRRARMAAVELPVILAAVLPVGGDGTGRRVGPRGPPSCIRLCGLVGWLTSVQGLPLRRRGRGAQEPSHPEAASLWTVPNEEETNAEVQVQGFGHPAGPGARRGRRGWRRGPDTVERRAGAPVCTAAGRW